ncbi:MAG: N-acetylmuramidase domain-containing protein [Sulfitobacter sp.]
MAFSKEVFDAIEALAQTEGLEANALKAVVEVESGGRAFATIDGKPMPLILYEYHVFYRWPGLSDAERKEAVQRKLAAKKWGDLPYVKSHSGRYNQLKRAATINEQAAYAACSWGVGQVLGENAEWLGFGTPKALAERAMDGIDGQLAVMLQFIKKRGLIDELSNHDWRGFARAYNGAGQVDYYATRMAAAYRKHAGQHSNPTDDVSLRLGMRGDDVADLQRHLRGLGYHLVIDADFGPATLRMVKQFQLENDLTPDGVAGPATFARIEVLRGVDHPDW